MTDNIKRNLRLTFLSQRRLRPSRPLHPIQWAGMVADSVGNLNNCLINHGKVMSTPVQFLIAS